MEKTIKQSTMGIASQVLDKAMEHDNRIVILAADLVGSCKISNLEYKYPNRFINVGIAEQNMIGVAAGLAKEGFKPFAFTFSTFASLRACEQIRTDVFYNGLNVKIVGTHSGLSSAPSGPTHYSLEDMGVIRSIPQSRLFVPSDAASTEYIFRQMVDDPNPAYIRLDRNPLPDVYSEFSGSNDSLVRVNGKDALIISCGCMTSIALVAVQKLKNLEGLSCGVLDMPYIKPLASDVLDKELAKYDVIFTVEEHSTTNGLGTAICEYVAKNGLSKKVIPIGINECYPRGMQLEENRNELMIDVDGIRIQILSVLK